MTIAEQRQAERENIAIEAAADALLAVCALQTGTDPWVAFRRAMGALAAVMDRAEGEATAAMNQAVSEAFHRGGQ